MNVIVRFAADFGEWLNKVARSKPNAIILVVLAFFSPLGFILASSLIAHAYRKNKKRG